MYWHSEYETLSFEIRTASENQQKIILSAYKDALDFFSHRGADITDFIVIRVEGVSCIAFCTNDFAPIEISPIVVPYDNERVYPIIGIESKIVFTVDIEN